jgi:AcrR family transcriptional regulator
MELFWKRGYDNTTLQDLQTAMGDISPPSFYAAFGSKEQVFAEAVELYKSEVACDAVTALMTGKTARQSIEAFMRASLKMFTSTSSPRGCLMLMGALNSTNPAADRMLRDHRCQGQEMLRERIKRGVTDGDVPKGADVNAVAAFYTTVSHGLSVSAKDGIPTATLARVVDGAIGAWDAVTGPGKRASGRRS